MNYVWILQIVQKREGKRALCLLGQNSRRPLAHPSQRARARFEPDGRGPAASGRERGRERGEDDRRGPPVISDLATIGPACSPAVMQGTTGRADGTVGLSVESPFGWWWWTSPELPGSPATRKHGGGASGGGCFSRLQLQTKGKRRGKESVARCGSISSERSSGGGSYHANTGDPRRRRLARSRAQRGGGELGLCW